MSAKSSTVLASGLAIVAVAALAFLALPSGPKGAALTARQRAMQMLGARIAKLRPQCKVLVLSNPFTQKSGYLNEKNQ